MATSSTADNTKPAFDSAAGKEALDLLKGMAVTDKSVYLDNGNGNYLNLFNSGKIAMLWTGPWDLSSINADVDYGVTLLPGPRRQPRDHLRARPLHGLRPLQGPVGDRGEVHDLADLGAGALQFAIATGDLPLRESESKLPEYSQFLKKYPANKVFVDNLNNVKHVRPNITSYSEVSTAVGQMVQSVLLGQAEPQEALDTASDQVASVLAGQ